MTDKSASEKPCKINSANSYCTRILSPREKEVLTLSALGKTYAEIANMLFMSDNAVKDHLERIRRKLNTGNKTHSVAIAISLGLIVVDADRLSTKYP